MSIKKILGALALVFVAIVAAGIWWVASIESIPLTAADLEKGGSYSAEEKAALNAACLINDKKKGTNTCACVTAKAGTELSRYERLLLTDVFENNTKRLLGTAKGAFRSSQEEITALAASIEARKDQMMQRMRALAKTCA